MTHDAFPEFELRCLPGVTVLEGEFVDHAALHGVIERIHSMALELISVRLIEGDDKPTPPPFPAPKENRSPRSQASPGRSCRSPNAPMSVPRRTPPSPPTRPSRRSHRCGHRPVRR